MSDYTGKIEQLQKETAKRLVDAAELFGISSGLYTPAYGAVILGLIYDLIYEKPAMTVGSKYDRKTHELQLTIKKETDEGS